MHGKSHEVEGAAPLGPVRNVGATADSSRHTSAYFRTVWISPFSSGAGRSIFISSFIIFTNASMPRDSVFTSESVLVSLVRKFVDDAKIS